MPENNEQFNSTEHSDFLLHRSLILYSRKFSSGTFEQVSQLVKEVVALTEECCAEGAVPNCYDTRVSVCLATSTLAQRKNGCRHICHLSKTL